MAAEGKDPQSNHFKSDINLIQFAVDHGYAIVKAKSSSNCVQMVNAAHDKINVARSPDGHWTYYSLRDTSDNGSIVDFLKHREFRHLEARDYRPVYDRLREWTNTSRAPIPELYRELHHVPKDRAAVAREFAGAEVRTRNAYLESERGLSPDTLQCSRFSGRWKVLRSLSKDGTRSFTNVVFPHFDEQGVCGYEKKNRSFTGFSSAGEKGLWVSNLRRDDDRLIVVESAIDAMSHYQLHPSQSARYVSLGGQENPRQPVLLEKAIAKMPEGSRILAASDNDKFGHELAGRVRELCERHAHVTFERHVPELKDWNDVVRDRRDKALEQSKGLER